MVNLRPDADPETEYVVFERWRILRVLERIAADLDDLVLQRYFGQSLMPYLTFAIVSLSRSANGTVRNRRH